MSIRTRLALSILLSLLIPSSAFPQENATASNSGDRTIYLDVVVTPRSGSPVAALEKQDFTLLDNKTVQPITSFRAFGKEAPVEVILVIDAVNTNYTTVAYARGQIENFLKANGGKLAHPTALAVFTDSGVKLQDNFSTDGNAVSAAFENYVVSLRSITRSAGFYGATDRLQLSLNALNSLAGREAHRPGRKLVLWISPGWPLLSGPGVQLDAKEEKQIFSEIVGMSTQLRQAGITLYSIDPHGAEDIGIRTFYYQTFLKGVTKPSQVQIGNLGLQVLAVQSGGLALNSSNDTASLLKTCIADTDAYYEISFDPPRGEPDEYHSIQVRVNKAGLTARTRTGYYSQP